MPPVEGGAKVRCRIAVLVSRFPKLTETFILRELIEMERQGQPVLLVPMMEGRERVVHPEAKAWADRALTAPWISPAIAAANVSTFIRKPLQYAALLLRVVLASLFSPSVLVRTVAIFAKAVYLAGRFEREGIRHIHAHWATYPTTIAFIIASLSDITYSFTAHAHDIFVNRTLLAAKMRAARFVRAISEFNREFLLTVVPGADRAKIDVIRVGIDPDHYPPARFENVIPAILCVASLQPYKGLHVLIDACRILMREGRQFTCTIIGDGPLRGELQKRIDREALGECVRLAGPKTQGEVAEAMREASMFVLPSVIAPTGQMEGIPVALMEAMATRLPVAASAISGIPELVEDRVSGLLVDPANPDDLARALRQLMDDPAAARALGERGRARVESEFRLATTVEQLLARIDRENVVEGGAGDLAAACRSLAEGKTIGVASHEVRTDSEIAEVLVSDGKAEVRGIVKRHKSREGESAPPSERSAREAATIAMLTPLFDGRAYARGEREVALTLPRLLARDDRCAAILLEKAAGLRLDRIIRHARFSRSKAEAIDGLEAAGAWLATLQTATSEARGRDEAIALIVERARRDMDALESRGWKRSQRQRVETAIERMARREQQQAAGTVGHHGDFWPGNIFCSREAVRVIDFEGYRRGVPLEDVAWFLLHLELFFTLPLLGATARMLRSAFLFGYAGGRAVDLASLDFHLAVKSLQILAAERWTGLMAHAKRRFLEGIIVEAKA